MSILFQDAAGQSYRMNAWNWGVLHHIVARMNMYPDELWAPMRYSGGGDFDAAQIAELADFLEQTLLPRIPPDHRMFFDLSVTDAPDDGTLYRGDEIEKNYSLRNDVLVELIAFLKTVTPPLSFY
jgi:hypothetical protein